VVNVAVQLPHESRVDLTRSPARGGATRESRLLWCLMLNWLRCVVMRFDG